MAYGVPVTTRSPLSDLIFAWKGVGKSPDGSAKRTGFEEIKMLELATLFLLTLVLSAITIWLYRGLSGWKGLDEYLVRGLIGKMVIKSLDRVGLYRFCQHQMKRLKT